VRVAAGLLVSAVLLSAPAWAQKPDHERDNDRRVDRDRYHDYRYRDRYHNPRYEPSPAPKVGEANPYAPVVGAPNPYATQGGQPNPYATQGGTPPRDLGQRAPRYR
jgi:hypothetical protein